MDLVRAVQIANLRSISKEEIKFYEHYIFRYVTKFKSLYKFAKVNQSTMLLCTTAIYSGVLGRRTRMVPRSMSDISTLCRVRTTI